MSDLMGSWRVASASEPAAHRQGTHAYYFSASGELILSTAAERGIERAMLTWKRRGDSLVIDQPSSPREDMLRYLRGSDQTMQIDDSWYVRDEPGHHLDEEAPWWALVAGGAWYGIENASPEPFIPFLMLEGPGARRLQRVVTRTAVEAEKSSALLLARETYERAVWVRDGRISRDAGKIDAILATRYEPGAQRGITHALPYCLEGTRARILGGLETVV